MGESISLPDEVVAFANAATTGVLATTRPDGSVRQSVVYLTVEDGRVLVSTLSGRAKARDVARAGAASVCVFGHSRPFPSVTIAGVARIVTDAAQVGRVTREMGRRAFGDKAPSPSDEEIVGAGRVLIEIVPEQVYGASYLPRS